MAALAAQRLRRRAKAPAVKPGPRIYYRWKDAKGVVHMTQSPPTTGEYSTIKSTD